MQYLQRKRHNAALVWVGLVLLCFLLVACGTPPAARHPLSQVDAGGTTSTGSSDKVSGDVTMQPIQVQQSNLTAYPGGQMSMTISTSPYALCTFSVAYGKSTSSTNVGVVPHTADAQGMVSWLWRVDSDAHTGTWPLTIAAMLPSGARQTKVISVRVIFPPITVVSSQTNLTAYPRQNMALTISTAPNVQCLLVLNYGPSKPTKGLKSVADSNGIARWAWRVDNKAVAGAWPLTITVTLADGEQGNAQVTMTIM